MACLSGEAVVLMLRAYANKQMCDTEFQIRSFEPQFQLNALAERMPAIQVTVFETEPLPSPHRCSASQWCYNSRRSRGSKIHSMPDAPNPACKHKRTQVIAKDDNAEYVECLDCGEILDVDELKEKDPGFGESIADA
jgi:hypothetical protein